MKEIRNNTLSYLKSQNFSCILKLHLNYDKVYMNYQKIAHIKFFVLLILH